MKTVLAFLVLAFVLFIISCRKGKFETRPRIEVKGYNTREVPPHGQLVIHLNYYDKEGDLGGGDFFAARYRLNIRPLAGSDANLPDTLDAAHGYTVPVFPAKDQGEIDLTLDWDGFLKESNAENDTIYFRIAVSDKAGNKSDTINTDPIVILKP
ncbi:MAG: hypothetical protein Q8941_03440 [Bacteroidota bacterium]|nr:hypothetical protein [Bacteroidota bacterium]